MTVPQMSSQGAEQCPTVGVVREGFLGVVTSKLPLT